VPWTHQINDQLTSKLVMAKSQIRRLRAMKQYEEKYH